MILPEILQAELSKANEELARLKEQAAQAAELREQLNNARGELDSCKGQADEVEYLQQQVRVQLPCSLLLGFAGDSCRIASGQLPTSGEIGVGWLRVGSHGGTGGGV